MGTEASTAEHTGGNAESPPEYRVPPPDEVTAGWWDATRERRLVVQRCLDCAHLQHYPRALCTACGKTSLEFTDVSGRGRIDTYSVTHRAPRPDLTPPYVVARVRLAEGPVLLTNIVDCPLDRLACDLPVVLAWRPLPDGRALPVFRPDPDA
ncbi:Zn-ribbon domain-containing OB-fold protein [Yinghuangia seranimata]|uniref:Zn-ribbon domain-containing OB-fold protein n=1 Tax=Yinghuangia seranimata TaxID=408067 RepID=UPI00248AE42A|nr:Zn-ribbon domain-containing OB-fold protein [Yinghuangia seranimata]MDI2131870.1 Zn-ribbon domain-containing OB-fold protein [Yinghuangia seranimata]